MKHLEIPTETGPLSVPVYFVDGVNGLAVTMTNFGAFEVTHVKSGFRIIGGFERFATALVHMLSIYLALKEAEINIDTEAGEFKAQVMESNHESEFLDGLTFKGYMNIVRPILGFSGEFPWEGDDEGPHAEAYKLMEKLRNQNGITKSKLA
ncbi:hypothetical protein [Vibrio sp. Vb0304]|uniref:hypothetical protein n=1 Tax=Vibrio sp. Vb0304 TaxID=3074623 RepID=UPI0029653933|nr:hypothetical protein [Vibrio sp. Vb0304]MDW1981940.1 hypothetical protein [Vibrio sp. Vb0304]